MAATKLDIISWFEQGLRMEARPTHMVIVCDTFDWSDYPIYATSKEQAIRTYANPGDMQKVMEVYDLRMDMDAQLAEYRAWHF